MDICTSREVLVDVLSRVGGVVEKRQTLPILGNFLISARDDWIQVTGTDLEVEVRARVGAEVRREGEITVPARKLMDISRALREGCKVSLKVSGERALLVAGKSRFMLSMLPSDDFPVMEAGEVLEGFQVKRDCLKNLLEKTAFSMAHQDVRYYLNGLLLEMKPERLVAVATDGHRLAKVEEEIALGVAEEMQIILPRKTVLELSRLLGGGGGQQVRVGFSEKFFSCEMGDTVLTSKLVDGRYPDYRRVIPPLSERVAYADRDSLKQALLRAAILSGEKYKGVRFGLEEGRLRLTAANPEQEEAEEELDVEYAHEPLVIGFNIGYMSDILGVLDEEEVEIWIKDSNSSAVVRNKGKEEETFVVMPMRL